MRDARAGMSVVMAAVAILCSAAPSLTLAAADDDGSVAASRTSRTESPPLAPGPVPRFPDAPEQPIIIPALDENADKESLLRVYYDMTGRRVMDGLVQHHARTPDFLLQRHAECSPALDRVNRFFVEDFGSFLRRLAVEAQTEVMDLLRDALTEEDLKAFFRFARTEDGQRHLNGFSGDFVGNELPGYPAFAKDPALRGYYKRLNASMSRLQGFDKMLSPTEEMKEKAMEARREVELLQEECDRSSAREGG